MPNLQAPSPALLRVMFRATTISTRTTIPTVISLCRPSLHVQYEHAQPYRRPYLQTQTQTRGIANSNYAPPSHYRKVNSLDKLHRQQKKAVRAEKQRTIDRAAAMVLPAPAPPQPQTLSQSTTETPTETTNPYPFSIERTPSLNLPIYQSSVGGGTKHITTIRKLSGNLDAFATELKKVLELTQSFKDQAGRRKENVVVKRMVGHVVVRGWRGAEVEVWLKSVGF